MNGTSTASISPETNFNEETFAVGSELGLTGTIPKHICGAVTKALSFTSPSHLKSGDYQTIRPSESDKIPDLVMLTVPRHKILLVGEIKTFWTVFLEDYPVTSGYATFVNLQHHFSQVAMYMRDHELKYSFLTTYRTTVFIRRTENFRFELSLPIDEQSPPRFHPEQNRVPAEIYYQASTQPSPFRHQVKIKDNTSGESVGPESIIFRTEGTDVSKIINCKGIIQRTKARAIFNITWDGKPAIAKCWSEGWYKSYAQETSVYIRCSSSFPKGNMLIISKVQGEPLTSQWTTLSPSSKLHIHSEVYKAIKVLRELSLVCIDAEMHNVLYDRVTNAVTMIDFELMQPVKPELVSPDLPEMYANFRNQLVQGQTRDSGG
ncbi:hypothetical protein BDQ94DRAFT_185222 [Aspergillus welwitschiae]|uniref:Protein kinase domain-containing protein n=1 Tax=Aspergillus welwitschiae TaxID=1341132 RepID=A0A3F3PJQ3_9EURO|nr:hypothetical protein BDQ94DRAFT_185222 [Aspergillus welwitschiae]RDH27107.1 hypothetical protein BDQ94DRAFT_185222 [Aspergillus welwitschiae]